MGIFNTEIFKELEDGLKNLSKHIKENMDDEKQTENVVQKCPNCGATLSQTEDSKVIKCPYCSTEVKNANYKKNWFED